MDPHARILALETSGKAASVAIGTGAGEPLGVEGPGARLFPAMAGLLERAGWTAASLTDVFLSIGPGSFTGLRTAVTIARTLAWSTGVRIVAVPTMDVLARNALTADEPPAHLGCLVDAKRNQAFCAAYRLENGAYTCIHPAELATPGPFLAALPRPLAVLGEGVPMHRAVLDAAGVQILPESFWPGRAEHVLTLGRLLADAGAFTPARELVPLYIRRPEMEERWEQRQKK